MVAREAIVYQRNGRSPHKQQYAYKVKSYAEAHHALTPVAHYRMEAERNGLGGVQISDEDDEKNELCR